MDKKEQLLRQEVRKIAARMIKESPNITEAGITGWMIDKVSSGLKWAVNRNADYQYDALLKSQDFKDLAKKHNKNDRGWEAAARRGIRNNPKEFAKMLAYDYSQSDYKRLGLF